MSTQPEALLCAEMLEVARDNPTWADYSEIPKEACRRSAAELRRQHAECNDLARQLNESNERNGRLKAERNDLARQLNESNERNGRLKAERDALLEACERCFSLLSATRHAVYSQSRVAPWL